jgi:hypothetical protein
VRTNFGGTLPSTTCPQHLAESARHAAWAIPDVPCELCLHKLALAVKEKATKETTAPFLLPHCNRQSNSCAQRTQIYPLRKGTMAGASRISSISSGVTKDDLLERIHGLPDKEKNRARTHNPERSTTDRWRRTSEPYPGLLRTSVPPGCRGFSPLIRVSTPGD